MCGITGIYHFDRQRPVDAGRLRRMADTLVHRGPDGEGFFIDRNVGLGHRRLSIIDLSTGDQPMLSPDKSIAVIFNGEIYNYIELRAELVNLGHRFTTSSDTEVIIHAYQHWGPDFQKKLNGMWAIALWDDRLQQLLISRDRLGEKPLYYSKFDGSLIFGSEIKALIAGGCPAEQNVELTELYLSTGYIPAPYSFYKNISKLRQGHYLIVKDRGVSEHQYWDVPLPDEGNMMRDRSRVYEQFKSIFSDAVKIRMRSDVPFGAFLSGGLDSASVVAEMSRSSDRPVETFTIGFSDKAFDERALAREVSAAFKTKHSEFMVEPDSFEDALHRVVYHYDEPFGDVSAIPTGYVSKIARQKVKMVLTGDGGDEVLSGYNGYQSEKFAGRYQRLPSFAKNTIPKVLSPLVALARGTVRYKLNQLHRVLESSLTSFESRLHKKSSWHIPNVIADMAAGMGPQMKFEDLLADFYTKYPVQEPFYKLMMFQLKVLLPDDYLVKTDRMSMAHSLETRIPFLDHRLVELMVQVSMNVKMEGYERKSVLRNTIGKALPVSLLKAPKKGFSVPIREWFKDRDFEQRLRTLATSDIGLNGKIIKQIVDQNSSGSVDYGNLLWVLFVYQRWVVQNSAHASDQLQQASTHMPG